ncbi:MAG: DUF421 domain-containing protein [Acidimicrobiia bacterium]|nr:DUF421 domain-containing protein [Acidimicrobiia bacterium]
MIAAAHPSQPTTAVLAAALATRTLIVALVVIGGLRLFGKRELGQLNIYDLAMLIALANAVQNAMTLGSGYLAAGFASAGALLLAAAALAAAARRSPRFERALAGSPTLLAFDGRLIPAHLRTEGVTAEEVDAAVREHGLDGLDQVLAATLEVDGTISIVDKSAAHRRHSRALAALWGGPRRPR